MFEPLSCSKSCIVWTRARTGVDTAKQGRHAGAVPAAGPQRVGPGHEDLAAEGAVLLRPRGPARPGRDRAAGRVADPAAGPGHRPDRHDHGRRRRGWRSPRPARWAGRGAGRAVAPAGDRHRADAGCWPGRKRDPRAERVLFALVANRALAPSSKLAATGWVADDVHIAGLAATTDDACYRAMDWLLDDRAGSGAGGVRPGRHLLNLEVDLLFFDTTSTYFETDEADEPVARDTHGRRLDPPARHRARTTDGGRRRRRRRGQAVGRGAKVGFRTYGKSQGLPRRPAPGRGRHGRHPRRDPGAGVVLAGQHHRLAR